MFFRLPEPKGRTYGELDTLFEQKVPARRFKATVVRISDMGMPMRESDDLAEKEDSRISVTEDMTARKSADFS